jgi:hypothetical protein
VTGEAELRVVGLFILPYFQASPFWQEAIESLLLQGGYRSGTENMVVEYIFRKDKTGGFSLFLFSLAMSIVFHNSEAGEFIKSNIAVQHYVSSMKTKYGADIFVLPVS